MPFDGKNFPETKPDVFSLEGLVAWPETQPSREQYAPWDIENCLMTQYVEAHGGFCGFDGSPHYVVGDERLRIGKLPEPFAYVVFGGPCTMGMALRRARYMRDGSLLGRVLRQVARAMALLP